MRHILVLGTQPDISNAEAAAQYPTLNLTRVQGVLLTEGAERPTLSRLAGCIKIGEILFSCPTNELSAERIAAWVAEHPRGEGKLTFAVSFYGDRCSQSQRLPLELKRILREQTQRSVRWFADSDGQTSPAAIFKLGLIEEGYDFSIVVQKETAHVAATIEVQNPDLWSKIDFERPRRNAKNGMIPPKLAEMLVHLAGSNRQALFDPFCGSGTILEAAARGGISTVYGSDNAPMIIEDAKQNLAWAQRENLVPSDADIHLAVADATKSVDLPDASIDAIVTEGYLGQPLQGRESQDFLDNEQQDVRFLWEKSLAHWARILTPDGVIIAVWPEYKTARGEARVDVPDALLRELGLVRDTFPLADGRSSSELIYAREDQFVRRRIVKLKKSA